MKVTPSRRLMQFARTLRRRVWQRVPASQPEVADEPLAAILDTPPVITAGHASDDGESAPIGVHTLGSDAHLLPMLWTLKSFYHFAGVRFPLTIHLQGQNTTEMRRVLPLHFPQARLVTQDESDAVVEAWLREAGLLRLLAMRRQLFLMMKLIDLRLLARSTMVLYFDSDVLFFRRPHELLDRSGALAAEPHLYMRDLYPSYCVTPAQAAADLGVELVPFANSGLMRLVTERIDLDACERFLSHPLLAQPHWHLEQTLHALYASAQHGLKLLPDTYVLDNDPRSEMDGVVARHYTSPIRRLLTSEGIAHLVSAGFLGTATIGE